MGVCNLYHSFGLLASIFATLIHFQALRLYLPTLITVSGFQRPFLDPHLTVLASQRPFLQPLSQFLLSGVLENSKLKPKHNVR